MRRAFRILLLLLAVSAAERAAAGGGWSVEVHGGIPFHLPVPLSIRQTGEPDLRVNARYDARPFRNPLYYLVRVGRWRDGRAWEVELLHDKLYLSNPPPEVGDFSISHGYNHLVVNRAREIGGIVRRAGAGMVLTHPETTVRKKRLPEDRGLLGRGYYVSGATVQGALGKRFPRETSFFGALEGKLAASYARIPVADGAADVPDLSFHGTLGAGGRP